MNRPEPKIRILLLITIFCLPSILGAEAKVGIKMSLMDSVYRMGEDWYFLGTGSAGMSVKSTGKSNVKGEMQLDFYPYDLNTLSTESPPLLDIKKLYVRMKFGPVIANLGKTRLTWGEGRAFNAGDLLFGSINPYMDLTAEELRTDTAWLTSVNVPLGKRAFIEGVVIAPTISMTLTIQENPLTAESTVAPALGISGIEKSSAGGRIFLNLNRFKMEGGYLYKGEPKTPMDLKGHRMYMNFHGFIGIDWYLASSITIDNETMSEPLDYGRSWNISAGLFHMFDLGYRASMSLRLETMIFPFQRWEENSWSSMTTASSTGNLDTYGILLYPEISLVIDESVSLALTSVVSPVDISAQMTLFGSWGIYQGLSLLAAVSVNAGEEDDMFAWNSSTGAGISISTGVRYSY